jgi:hypothetical protein
VKFDTELLVMSGLVKNESWEAREGLKLLEISKSEALRDNMVREDKRVRGGGGGGWRKRVVRRDKESGGNREGSRVSHGEDTGPVLEVSSTKYCINYVVDLFLKDGFEVFLFKC